MISWGGQDAKRLGRPNVHWRKATMNWGAEQLPIFYISKYEFLIFFQPNIYNTLSIFNW